MPEDEKPSPYQQMLDQLDATGHRLIQELAEQTLPLLFEQAIARDGSIREGSLKSN